MANHENAAPSADAGAFGRTISFRGRLSRGQYLAWLLGEVALLAVGFGALAGLNNPTGGGSAPLVIAFPLAALYLHFCLVTARLRDAGVAKPVPLGMIVALLPFVWLGLTFERVESLWPVVLAGFVLLYFGPALPSSKAAETPQS